MARPYILLVGTCLFLVTFMIANLLLQRSFHYSYDSQPLVFSGLYVVAAIGGLWFLGPSQYIQFTRSTLGLLLVILLAYCVAGWYWMEPERSVSVSDWLVPDGSQISLDFTMAGQATKVVEIYFQQVCALLIITGLLAYGLNRVSASLVFASLVCVLHIPGLWLFGPYFGWFFLICSTTLAVVYPTILAISSKGVVWMSGVHVSVYILLFSYVTQAA